MAVRVDIDKAQCVAKIMAGFNKGLSLLSSEILNDCNQYCKEDTGVLIASSYIHSKLDEGILVWRTPYALRQYWEIPTAYQDLNPQATWRWCEYAKAARFRTWQRQAQRLLEMFL